MATIVEFFRHRGKPEASDENHDSYAEVFGERLDVESLISIREMEDYWIELGHIDESDRYPVPDYLQHEWLELVGPNEERRIRTNDE